MGIAKGCVLWLVNKDGMWVKSLQKTKERRWTDTSKENRKAR